MTSELEKQQNAHRERHKRFFPSAADAAETFPGRPVLVVIEPLARAPPEPEPVQPNAPTFHFPVNEVTRITQACAHHFGLRTSELLSPCRSKGVVRPRQIAMFLSNAAHKSLPDIGRRIGGRDHTTVLHGIRAIEALIKSDWTVACDVAEIEIELALAKRA